MASMRLCRALPARVNIKQSVASRRRECMLAPQLAQIPLHDYKKICECYSDLKLKLKYNNMKSSMSLLRDEPLGC
jgi:hypothetical protein